MFVNFINSLLVCLCLSIFFVGGYIGKCNGMETASEIETKATGDGTVNTTASSAQIESFPEESTREGVTVHRENISVEDNEKTKEELNTTSCCDSCCIGLQHDCQHCCSGVAALTCCMANCLCCPCKELGRCFKNCCHGCFVCCYPDEEERGEAKCAFAFCLYGCLALPFMCFKNCS